jgi:hypothetical protein
VTASQVRRLPAPASRIVHAPRLVLPVGTMSQLARVGIVPLATWVLALPIACSNGDPSKGGAAASASNAPSSASGSAASAAAPSSSAASAAASAPPATTVRVEPDPTIAEVLDRRALCEGRSKLVVPRPADAPVDLDTIAELFCPQDVAWEELVRRLEENDDLARSNHLRLATTCATRLRHESSWVRTAAYRCVADHPDGIAEPRVTLERVLAALETEAEADVREDMWKLVGALDPLRSGLEARAVELARKESANENAPPEALVALLPQAAHVPTGELTLAFAKELALQGRGGEPTVKLLLHAELTPSEACAIFESMLSSDGPHWHAGLRAMAEVHGHCRSSSAKATDAVVARVELARTKPTAWHRDANFALRDGTDVFADADKPRLRAALSKLRPEQREGFADDVIQTVLEQLQ